MKYKNIIIYYCSNHGALKGQNFIEHLNMSMFRKDTVRFKSV